MKILKERYPLGTIPRQQTPGRYINETLNDNIKLLAKNIIKDMTYLGIITSSTLEVGTGKSVFAQQFTEAYLDHIKKLHGIDNRLSMHNLVFRPKDIIERSFQVPQYSVVICDEWEDLHYWSELGKTLRQFFRKCRQLNLLILIIIPNFFQLPMSYAISRSVFLVDVKFSGEFDRGYFSFYNFNKKKNLFLAGKKRQDYNIIKPNFTGRFVDGYVVDEEQYKKEKLKDLIAQDELEQKPEFSKRGVIIMFLFPLLKKLREMEIKITDVQVSKALGVAGRTLSRWKKEFEAYSAPPLISDIDKSDTLLSTPTNQDDLSPARGEEKEMMEVEAKQ